jgi:predicted metal-dependent HD superfamily phosphohydrolase
MGAPDRQADVARYWNEVVDTCGIPCSDARSRAFTQLVAAYSEPHRHYHNLTHVGQVIDILVLWEFVAKDWKSLFLAGFYHDVIYDPRDSENECRSADLASRTLLELGLRADLANRVRQLILMTKDHGAPDGDGDALLFLGADLSILAMPKDLYDNYSQAIRREYAWVPERNYREGRRAILQDFLNRPRIYRSVHLFYLEDRARQNITAEIAQIDEILRTRPP